MNTTILANATTLLPSGLVEGMRVRVEGDRIAAIEPTPASDRDAGAAGGRATKRAAGGDRGGDADGGGRDAGDGDADRRGKDTAVGADDKTVAVATIDLRGHYLVPGFVDMHQHGGGGGSYNSGDPDEARRVAAFHRMHGSTTVVASLVTAPLDELERSIKSLGPAIADGTLAGIHLEGPYISPSRRGAHNPSYLRRPDKAEIARLLDVGNGTIIMLTIAPELPDALLVIEQLVAAGVLAAVGHTDATYTEARAAVAAGARVGTHLYNAMRTLHHREPGAAAALLQHKDVVVELINDGVHLHDTVVGITFDTVGPSRIALVTDAMAAAGAGDGIYPLGPMTVRVEAGVARLMGTGEIAGSTLTLDAAVRHAVKDVGLSLEAAVTAASATPARVLGLDDELGSIAVGKRADLVVLDENLMVTRVMRKGEWAL